VELAAGDELRRIGYIEFVDLVIDLRGGKADGFHVVAHFVAPVSVNRQFGNAVNENTHFGSCPQQTILGHASL
jgi:hypothetical protein